MLVTCLSKHFASLALLARPRDLDFANWNAHFDRNIYRTSHTLVLTLCKYIDQAYAKG